MIEGARELIETCRTLKWKIAVAESCTGGLIAAALTDIPGASEVFDRGFITYSNEAKTQMLGIPAELISQFGAVSERVAAKMAEGALLHSGANLSIAVTGIAGPSGGTPEKPIGLVYIATSLSEETTVQRHHLQGDRQRIRWDAMIQAIRQGLSCCQIVKSSSAGG